MQQDATRTIGACRVSRHHPPMSEPAPSPRVLSVVPPMTQLNTPYPATAYLKGFLNTKGYPSAQADLGIEVILELFSKNGLKTLIAC